MARKREAAKTKERTTRCRDRRARGDAYVRGDVTRAEIDSLIANGYLDASKRGDTAAVFEAVKKAAFDTRDKQRVTRNAAPGITRLFFEADETFINNIRDFGWLKGGKSLNQAIRDAVYSVFDADWEKSLTCNTLQTRRNASLFRWFSEAA